MRIRDDVKQEALFQATIKLVNKIGFASSSVAKIAKEARISPATIYIYFKNKEDLLVSTYVNIKHDMSEAMLKNFNKPLPIRDILKILWRDMFAYSSKHPEYIEFSIQFSNSPFADLVVKKDVEKYFEPILMVLQRGIDEKIIKNVGYEILTAFIFHPIISLSNRKICTGFELSDKNIDTAFTLAWDAIKL